MAAARPTLDRRSNHRDLFGDAPSRSNYPVNQTGLLVVDPYNDFLSDGGKLWPKVKAVAASVSLIAHLCALVATSRKLGIIVFYVPHRRWHGGRL